MRVRRVIPEDRLRVVQMLRDAHAAAKFPFAFSAPHAVSLFYAQSDMPDRLCVVAEDDDGKARGVLMGSAQGHPFADVKVATEVVWWIEPDFRGKAPLQEMLRQYEEWALERGCSFIGMAALDIAPRVSAIYRRRGYVAAEQHFIKPLVPATAN